MSNDHFKFKRFTIHQSHCAMKVTTLACIQGAWLPNILPSHILDIGGGTGLLSLMAAQRFNCQIDTVEVDSGSFAQMNENISNSPWSEKILCIHDDIKNFAYQNKNKYDFIISNPPFFENQLQSPRENINRAKHETGLSMKNLVDIISDKLDENGKASILLPSFETTKLVQLCKSKLLYPTSQLMISDSEKKDPKGIVTILSKKSTSLKTSQLMIKRIDGSYTERFKSLLKNYYLYL